MKHRLITPLHYFSIAAQCNSFTKAARQLNLSTSALSQAIQLLESTLAIKLFNRTTRSISLTEAGKTLYDQITPTLEEINHILEDAKSKQRNTSGTIRITMPYIAWKCLIYPKIIDFNTHYPNIDLDIQINDGYSHLIHEGLDIGIRSSSNIDQSMIAVPLSIPIQSYVVASPNYLKNRQSPQHPKEILLHDCIGYRFTTSQQLHLWTFVKGEDEITITPAHHYIVNDERALVQLAILGKGLAYVFDEQYVQDAIQEGQLIKVLTNWQAVKTQYYFYFPNRKYLPSKLRAFIDFFK